jgi:predicted CopG family antitoxin
MKTKLIRITEENYQALKDLGRTADSFNQVIGQLIEKNKNGGVS